jgi:uncharacterized protein (DUF1015 family)
MPKIKAFKGIHPDQAYAEQVVLQVENLDLDTARNIRNQNPLSYVHMLVPKLENRFLMGSKTELAFKKINENFDEFLEKGFFVRDEKPAIYIYRVNHLGFSQTGIWAVTAIDDYLNNTIKKHELTRAERERGLIDYVQQTGIDANPVLIAYEPDDAIEKIIAETVKQQPLLEINQAGAAHFLWKIDQEDQLKAITDAFAQMKSTYIADGHHRAAAASTYGIECRKLNLKHRGDEEYNFFTSVYMSTEQLRIFEFHRLVKDIKCSVSEFMDQLKQVFAVEQLADVKVFKPQKQHQFGLYIADNWYALDLKTKISSDNPVQSLDVSILQDLVLRKMLKIQDPRTDKRLSFAGGLTPIEGLVKKVDDGEFDALFTLYPTSIQELIQVADAGEVMPPKSTWFEPKFLAGLLIHKVN